MIKLIKTIMIENILSNSLMSTQRHIINEHAVSLKKEGGQKKSLTF